MESMAFLKRESNTSEFIAIYNTLEQSVLEIAAKRDGKGVTS
jgi:hypothetical protein